MSWEEFLEWDYEGFAEWVDGEVVILSPVTLLHARIASMLFQCIAYFVNERNLGEVFPEGYLMRMAHLRRGRLPDIMYVSNESLLRLENLFLDGPADLAVEVVSPDSKKRDRVEKYREYETAGVREYWLIDVPRKEARFFALDENRRYRSVELDDQGKFRSIVLNGLWLQPEWFWQSPLPNAMEISKMWANPTE
jgi:Uma2 family endonuclease